MLSRIVRIPIVNNECIYFVHPKMKQNARRFLNSMAVGIKGEGPCFFHTLRKFLHRVRMPVPVSAKTREWRETHEPKGPFARPLLAGQLPARCPVASPGRGAKGAVPGAAAPGTRRRTANAPGEAPA